MTTWIASVPAADVQRVEGDVVAFDSSSRQLHHITGDTRTVLEALPGTVEDIAAATGLTTEAVAAQLEALAATGLAETKGGTGRRALLGTAAAAATLAGITTIAAPAPSQAASVVNGGPQLAPQFLVSRGGVLYPTSASSSTTVYSAVKFNEQFQANGTGVTIDRATYAIKAKLGLDSSGADATFVSGALRWNTTSWTDMDDPDTSVDLSSALAGDVPAAIVAGMNAGTTYLTLLEMTTQQTAVSPRRWFELTVTAYLSDGSVQTSSDSNFGQ